MRILFSLLMGFAVLGAAAQIKPTEVRINDSLSLFETGTRLESYKDKPDSNNRLTVNCGIADYFKGNLFTLNYKNGVCYLSGRDSMALFLVDFRNTKNEVEIRDLELKSGMTLKAFERQIKRCKCKETREEVERVKGVKEIAYTVYQDETGLSYRVFFLEGKIQMLLMYIPCK